MRLRQAMARRGGSPESWWWETADSRRWHTRCVVATRSPCGPPRGVGRDTSSAFFAHLRRAWPIRLTPSSVIEASQDVCTEEVDDKERRNQRIVSKSLVCSSSWAKPEGLRGIK